MAFKIETERYGAIKIIPFDTDREVGVFIGDDHVYLRENDVVALRDHLTQLLIEQGVEEPIQTP